MSRPRRWYDAEADEVLRVVPRNRHEGINMFRWRHPKVMPTLSECLAYPLIDGPGLGLLALCPPVMWFLSLPVFDFIAVLEPLTKSNWALGLLVAPIFLPMLVSFAMTFGYVLLFLGHVLVASALGENDHPRWPEWEPDRIAEGIIRWLWAGIFGIGLGGLPIYAYWTLRGGIDWLDWVVFGGLILLATGFSLMALAAALMHDTIVAANPFTAGAAIAQIGRHYLMPCIVGSVVVCAVGFGVYGLLFRMPKMWMEAIAIWGFWTLFFYALMVLMRMIGLTYHAYSMELVWFRRRPRWATSRLNGQIYANS